MKILIIGAGISGLTTYLFLQKYLPDFTSHETTIYEAYDLSKLDSKSPTSTSASTTTRPDHPSSLTSSISHPLITASGSAVGVSSNGLSVLRRLDQDLFDEVMAQGCPTSRWHITNSRGWTLASVPTPAGVMIARHTLWSILHRRIPSGVILTRKVVDVIPRKASRNTVSFADGTVEEADLVLGADGLRSIVRTAMFREEMVLRGRDYITPVYEGLSGVGGFVDGTVLTESGCVPGTMNLVFGPNGFFGYGIIASEEASKDEGLRGKTTGGWWSTYHEATPPQRKPLDKPALSAALASRHGQWKSPTISAILSSIALDTTAITDIYPTYTTPPLPRWEIHGCILLGDAAHALQPSSGQGASLAFEDAESFTLLLTHYLSRTAAVSFQAAIEKAGKEYESLRRPRVQEVYVRSQQMSRMKGEMGFVGEMVMSAAIWAMSKFVRRIIFRWFRGTWLTTMLDVPAFFTDAYNERLTNYDVPKEVEAVIKKDG